MLLGTDRRPGLRIRAAACRCSKATGERNVLFPWSGTTGLPCDGSSGGLHHSGSSPQSFAGGLSVAERGWDRSGRALVADAGSATSVIYTCPGLLWLHFKDLGWPAEGELEQDPSVGTVSVHPGGPHVKLMTSPPYRGPAAAGCWSTTGSRRGKRANRVSSGS